MFTVCTLPLTRSSSCLTLPALRQGTYQPPPGSAGARHSTFPEGCQAMAEKETAAAATKDSVRLINMLVASLVCFCAGSRNTCADRASEQAATGSSLRQVKS